MLRQVTRRRNLGSRVCPHPPAVLEPNRLSAKLDVIHTTDLGHTFTIELGQGLAVSQITIENGTDFSCLTVFEYPSLSVLIEQEIHFLQRFERSLSLRLQYALRLNVRTLIRTG